MDGKWELEELKALYMWKMYVCIDNLSLKIYIGYIYVDLQGVYIPYSIWSIYLSIYHAYNEFKNKMWI